VASAVASQPEGVGSIPGVGVPSVWSAFSPWQRGFPPGSPASSHSPKTCSSGKLISKCPVGVNVRVSGCLSLCGPWMTSDLSR